MGLIYNDCLQAADDGSFLTVPMQESLDFQMRRLLLDETLVNRMKTIKAIQPNVRFRLYVKAGAVKTIQDHAVQDSL